MLKEHMDSIDNRSLGEATAFVHRHGKIIEAAIEDIVHFSTTSNNT